jgi:hypothetical protein
MYRLWIVKLGIGVLAVVALAGCGGGAKTVTVTAQSGGVETGATNIPLTSTTSGSSSVTAASSTTSAAAPVNVVHLTTFESPSRNIGCVVLDGTARCDINHRDWSPPARPTKCPNVVDFGQGLEVTRSGPGQLVCAGDTAMDPSAPKLAYGSASVEGDLRCVSATTGMTCTNTSTAHGFSISIQRYRVF